MPRSFLAELLVVFLLGDAGAACAQSLEPAVEKAIDDGYQSCFKEIEIDGRTYQLRIPFGENGERVEKGLFEQQVAFGGRGEPPEIWKQVASLLAGGDFRQYAEALTRPGEKVVLLYIDTRSWAASGDPEELERVTGAPYPGTRTQVVVIKDGADLRIEDIYNYLYCVGAVGMDCAGFVFFIQKSIARSLGDDLDQIIGAALGTSSAEVPQIIGLWYFDPANGYADEVDDRISNLRPGDVFLFRGRRGQFRHSAVIQSIDLANGVIRYLQCTDWAPQPERGVHESFIYFDPASPDIGLRDASVRWTQQVLPTFPGEPGLRYWRNDGDRYRAGWPTGHSLVVRLRPVEQLIEEADPGYYGPGRQPGK